MHSKTVSARQTFRNTHSDSFLCLECSHGLVHVSSPSLFLMISEKETHHILVPIKSCSISLILNIILLQLPFYIVIASYGYL